MFTYPTLNSKRKYFVLLQLCRKIFHARVIHSLKIFNIKKVNIEIKISFTQKVHF